MTIIIAKCFDDAEYVNKGYSVVATLDNVRVKENSSIINPVFIIHTPADLGFNYVIVSAWGRKYYVRNITVINASSIEVECHVDVLASFASGIRACTAIVDKQQNMAGDARYIDDGSYVMECRDKIEAYNFNNGFTSSAHILITAGG